MLGIALVIQLYELSVLKNDFEKKLDQMVVDAKADIKMNIDGLSRATSDARTKVAVEMQSFDELGRKIEEFKQRFESQQNKAISIEVQSSGSASKAPGDSGY